MARRLYSAAQVAAILGISRQAFDQAVEEKRIEENRYITNHVRGWTVEQIDRILLKYKKEEKE